MKSVIGATILRRSFARSIDSYWPDKLIARRLWGPLSDAAGLDRKGKLRNNWRPLLGGIKLGGAQVKGTKCRSKPKPCHAFAGSNPASGVIFVAISTSNNMVVRTLAEMVMSASETSGCCSASESRRSLTL
jgi:hypothetical protein